MISDIYIYDLLPNRNKKQAILVLSVDEKFKNKVVKEDNRIYVGFAENSYESISNYAGYFKFFMRIIEEIETVIIDSHFYSCAVAAIHAAALNSKNVKYVLLYDDKDSEKPMEMCTCDESFSSSVHEKEKTYSRQQFLDS